MKIKQVTIAVADEQRLTRCGRKNKLNLLLNMWRSCQRDQLKSCAWSIIKRETIKMGVYTKGNQMFEKSNLPEVTLAKRSTFFKIWRVLQESISRIYEHFFRLTLKNFKLCLFGPTVLCSNIILLSRKKGSLSN